MSAASRFRRSFRRLLRGTLALRGSSDTARSPWTHWSSQASWPRPPATSSTGPASSRLRPNLSTIHAPNSTCRAACRRFRLSSPGTKRQALRFACLSYAANGSAASCLRSWSRRDRRRRPHVSSERVPKRVPVGAVFRRARVAAGPHFTKHVLLLPCIRVLGRLLRGWSFRKDRKRVAAQRPEASSRARGLFPRLDDDEVGPFGRRGERRGGARELPLVVPARPHDVEEHEVLAEPPPSHQFRQALDRALR